MQSTMLLTLLAFLPNRLLAIPTESSSIDPSLLFDRAIGSSCSTPFGSGSCQKTSSCTTQGFHVAGHCPNDPTDVQCCVKETCSTDAGSGLCMNTDSTCSGKFVAGACPGPDSVQCCVKTGTTSPSGLRSLDLSTPQSSKFWTCAAKEGIKKVIVRGYMQACGVGGKVDSNMVETYKAAKKAGITNIDAYMFPCTGTQPGGVVCKSISEQIKEFLAAIDDNKIPVKHLWLDLEPTIAPPCNAFHLGTAENIALAKKWIAAIKATNRNWGIYANANQWASMFGSKNVDIASDLPFWAVQDDNVPGVNTVKAKSLMGGWKKAYAKQYKLDTKFCGANVDLDSFTA